MTVEPLVTFTWRRIDCPPYAADDYLTDGSRLFRVVAAFDNHPAREFAVLEDCLTLEVDTYTQADLASMALSAVSRRSTASRC